MLLSREGIGEILSACGLPPEAFPRQFFGRALSRGRLSHAYLFIGSPDSGRRRFAQELAKAIFCKAGAPCGLCPSCLAVEHGNHAGVHRYGPDEGKTTVEISKVRDLEAKVHLRREDFLVAIIEDADRMSLPAANAVLKTLEEPTGSALMILLAESSGGLLPTIVSRCHRILFPVAKSAPAEEQAGEQAGKESSAEANGSLRAEAGDVDRAVDRALADLADPGFFSEREPRSWLSGHFPGETGSRDLVRSFLDRLIARGRAHWESGHCAPGGAPGDEVSGNEEMTARAMEELLDLRADLDRNVHPDLILEAVFALLSPPR